MRLQSDFRRVSRKKKSVEGGVSDFSITCITDKNTRKCKYMYLEMKSAITGTWIILDNIRGLKMPFGNIKKNEAQ